MARKLAAPLTRREQLNKLPLRSYKGKLDLFELAWELDLNIEGLRKCDVVELIARAEEKRNGS